MSVLMISYGLSGTSCCIIYLFSCTVEIKDIVIFSIFLDIIVYADPVY